MEPRRKGFVLVNHSPGVYSLRKGHKSEFDRLRASGWRIALIRPICTSLEVKLYNLPEEILSDRAFSYSLCILEKREG